MRRRIMRRVTVLALAIFTLSVCSGQAARADDAPIRLRSAATCRTTGGSEVTLPPGVYLPEPAWLKLDAEVARLQAAETRLAAENRSLRGSLADGGPMATLSWIGAALLLGAAAGATAGYYLK